MCVPCAPVWKKLTNELTHFGLNIEHSGVDHNITYLLSISKPKFLMRKVVVNGVIRKAFATTHVFLPILTLAHATEYIFFHLKHSSSSAEEK